MSEHRFPYRWRLADGYPAKGIEHHGCKVFGTFICGGGSTMGYKLAGYDHLGGVEIDPSIAKTYIENHHPTYMFVEDLRKFNERDDLPPELYDLDILDGSPPCSTFSIAGKREAGWGKKKKFREGQAEQTLDDLVFVYCDTIAKLRPRVFILENVAGLVKGNAKSYCRRIIDKLAASGYKRTQLFLLNAATMGVPQTRIRTFFIGLRDDLSKLPKLTINPAEPPILFGECIDRSDKSCNVSKSTFEIWKRRAPGDVRLADILIRETGKETRFNWKLMRSDRVAFALHTFDILMTYDYPRRLTQGERYLVSTFPTDYKAEYKDAVFLTGMSVAPVQMAHIASAIWEQWLKPLGRGKCAAPTKQLCALCVSAPLR